MTRATTTMTMMATTTTMLATTKTTRMTMTELRPLRMSMFHLVDELDEQPRMTMFRTLAVGRAVHGVGYGHGIVPVPERGHDHGGDHDHGHVDDHVCARGSAPDLNARGQR
jgi:hypothetical protein